MDYNDVLNFIASGRNKDQRRTGQRGTLWHKNPDNSVSFQYHDTDVLTLFPDGRIKLNSGGWKTVTTKARINEVISPGYLNQEKGIWFYSLNGSRFLFHDNMVINPDGKPVDAKPYAASAQKANNKLIARIKKYVKAYMDALFSGKVPAPSAGDCWFCAMFAQDKNYRGTDHLKEHFRQKYYVPSLLVRAIERFPVSIIAKSTLGFIWKHHQENCESFYGVTRQQCGKSLYRYIKEQFGIAA